MKVILVCCLVAAVAVSFDSDINIVYPRPKAEHPVMNLPRSLRQENWIRNRSGSCVVASMVSLLRWQGHPKLAAKLKKNYGGGQYYDTWNYRLNQSGVRFASTYNRNDVAFLERCIATRRGAMVTVDKGSHMVCLVDLTPTMAAILDNNYPGEIYWIDRDDFLKEWRNAYSWACTPIYTPTSPTVPK